MTGHSTGDRIVLLIFWFFSEGGGGVFYFFQSTQTPEFLKSRIKYDLSSGVLRPVDNKKMVSRASKVPSHTLPSAFQGWHQGTMISSYVISIIK